jgi:large subunit ribosomal protein L7/L12
MLIDHEFMQLAAADRPLSDFIRWADARGLMLKIEAVRKPPVPKKADGPSTRMPGLCQLKLIDIGRQKIQVIKAVREITGLGLQDAKALVDTAPSAILEGLDQYELGEARDKLLAVGAEAKVVLA